MFTIADAQQFTCLTAGLAGSLLHKAARRGLVSRIKPGVFAVVPSELGSAVEYAANPYPVARPRGAPHAAGGESSLALAVRQPPMHLAAEPIRR